MKSPTAILTADWHLRETRPVGRTDDFLTAQWEKVEFIINLADELQVPILHAGDIFDKAKSSPYVEAQTIKLLSDSYMVAVPGNHDLPNHNINRLDHSSFGVLQAAGIITSIEETNWNYDIALFPWGTPLESLYKTEANIAIIHELVSKGEDPWPGAESKEGKKLLQKAKSYQLILTGHNHKAFVIHHQGRVLVNPGSLMRTTAIQIGYRPRVYLWESETNKVVPVYLPIKEGVLERGHIDTVEIRDKRITAFVERLTDKYEVGLSFQNNLEQFFKANKISKAERELIWESME